MIGNLKKTKNISQSGGEGLSYHKVVVYSDEDKEYITLLITDSEMDRLKVRALKNTEDESSPSWFARLIHGIIK